MSYQFINLVRQTSKSGKDSVSKQVGGRDDLCNAAAGVAVLVAGDGRAALIKPADLLAHGQHAVEPHDRPEAFTATLWLDRQGGCGWTIWSYRFCDGLVPVPLVLIDFDRGPFSLGVLTDVVARLDALHTAVIGAQPHMVHSVAVCLSVPTQLVDAAWQAMERVFGERRVVMEHVAMMRGQGPRIGVDEVNAAFLDQAEQVMLDCAAIVGMGKVKMAATALVRSRGRPLAGILSAPAGERVDADPLRMAALIEIRSLGQALPQRSDGAAVRWG
jgi:hypothetical protein